MIKTEFPNKFISLGFFDFGELLEKKKKIMRNKAVFETKEIKVFNKKVSVNFKGDTINVKMLILTQKEKRRHKRK